MLPLRPFFYYFGAKYRYATLYPKPRHEFIIEPFAGAAGYSLHYYDRKILLVEKYPLLADLWKYLIRVKASEIRRIPIVSNLEYLPNHLPPEVHSLVGFCLGVGNTQPRPKASPMNNWSAQWRERVASQVERIRHWKVIYGNYYDAPDLHATWFIDPPYQRAGDQYVHGAPSINFEVLGEWCTTRVGQVMVCENEGATWLPFKPFRQFQATMCSWSSEHNDNGSMEVLWQAAHESRLSIEKKTMNALDQLIALTTDGHPIETSDRHCYQCGLLRYGPGGRSRLDTFLFLARAVLEQWSKDFGAFGADDSPAKVKIESAVDTVSLSTPRLRVEFSTQRVTVWVEQEARLFRWRELCNGASDFARRVETDCLGD